MGCVYLVTNKVNGKQYVGQTMQTFEARKNAHICYSKNPGSKNFHAFQAAIAKYGEENFIWEVIFESDNEQELRTFEKEKIAELGSFCNGYNLTAGGEEYYRGGPVIVVCEGCRKEFEVSRSKYNGNTKTNLKFVCSNECYSNYMKRKNSGNGNPNYGKKHAEPFGPHPVTVECANCKSTFIVSKSKYNSYIKQNSLFFCKKMCMLQHRSKKMRGENNPKYKDGKRIGEMKRNKRNEQ